MTRETFTPSPSYPVAGTGPYQITHPYKEGSLVVAVVLDGVRVELTDSDYAIAPVASTTTGEITLTAQAALDHDGATLYVRRSTAIEQGWSGDTSREKGLENQVDWLTEAVQDLTFGIQRSVRSETAMPPVTPKDGFTIVWSDELGFVPGPKGDDIAAVGINAAAVAEIAAQFGDVAGAIAAAAELRDEAQEFAQYPEDTPIPTGGFSALHHSAKANAQRVLSETARGGAETAETNAAADRVLAQTAAANAQSSALTVGTWATLSGLTGTSDGMGAEVLDSDGGNHSAASGTGYNGATVNNAGRYSWNASWSRWVRIGGTGLSGKAPAAAGVYSCAAVQDGSDPNLVLLTNAAIPSPPVEGQRITFIAPFTNTGNLSLKINGGPVLSVSQLNNGAVFAGAVTINYVVEFTYFGAPSNKYKLTTLVQSSSEIRDGLVARPSTFGGTANALTVTLRQAAVDRQLLLIKPTANNTGAATLNVKNAADVASDGLGVTTSIINMDGTPITADTLVAGRFVLLMLDASSGNPWRILADGASLGAIQENAADIVDLQGRMTTVEGALGFDLFTAEAQSLMEKINGPALSDPDYATSPRNPNNFFEWSEGVRTQAAPTDIKILNFGCSTDRDLHSGKSPSLLAISELTRTFAYLRNLSFTRTNVAVGGAFLADFLAQINGAAAGDFDIVMGGQPVNSASIGSVMGVNDFDLYRGRLKGVIAAARGRNAMPIIIKAYHNHLDYPQAIPDTYKASWPDGNQTYDVTANHEFDGAGGRIKLVAINTYGYTLTNGDKIQVVTGDGAGTYTITAIDWATNWVSFAEPVPFTGIYNVKVRNVEVDEERVFWPPQSQLQVNRDRTGNGIILPGWRPTDMVNQLYDQVCAEDGVMVWDMQKAQYLFFEKKLAENPTWTTTQLFNSMFNWVSPPGVQFNHANEAFFEWAGQRFAGQFSTAIENGTLHENRAIW